jgi:hypothetical protein
MVLSVSAMQASNKQKMKTWILHAATGIAVVAAVQAAGKQKAAATIVNDNRRQKAKPTPSAGLGMHYRAARDKQRWHHSAGQVLRHCAKRQVEKTPAANLSAMPVQQQTTSLQLQQPSLVDK